MFEFFAITHASWRFWRCGNVAFGAFFQFTGISGRLGTTDQAHTTTSATRPQDHKWKPEKGGLNHHLATLCWPPWPQSGETETMGASIEWRCDGSGLLPEAFRLREALVDSGLLTETMGANRLLF